MSHDTTPTKTCAKCGQEFPATTEFFHRKKDGKYGLSSICKLCAKEKSKRYVESNKDKISKKNKIYYLENRDDFLENRREYVAENKDLVRQQKRAHYIRNRERLLQQKREYRARNRDRIRKKNKLYRKQNAKKLKQYARSKGRLKQYRINAANRYARKRNLPDTFTVEEWEYCLEYFNYTCPVCDSQLRDLFGNVEPHADHWIPLSHEDCPGTVATNMVCLCSKCNQQKSAKLPDEWLNQEYGTRKANEILARIEAYFSSLNT